MFLALKLAGADPGECNRCVCNGQIFLIKTANVCELGYAIPFQGSPQSLSYNLVFKFVIQNYLITLRNRTVSGYVRILHERGCACFFNSKQDAL